MMGVKGKNRQQAIGEGMKDEKGQKIWTMIVNRARGKARMNYESGRMKGIKAWLVVVGRVRGDKKRMKDESGKRLRVRCCTAT